ALMSASISSLDQPRALPGRQIPRALKLICVSVTDEPGPVQRRGAAVLGLPSRPPLLDQVQLGPAPGPGLSSPRQPTLPQPPPPPNQRPTTLATSRPVSASGPFHREAPTVCAPACRKARRRPSTPWPTSTCPSPVSQADSTTNSVPQRSMSSTSKASSSPSLR